MASLASALTGERTARTSDLAYEQLRSMIVNLQLPPGALADEQSLAAELGVGRTPVHEAMARLAADQLVIIMPRRGLIIAPIGLENVREIFEAREAIECGNAYFAAQHASDADLAELRTLIEASEAAREVSDLQLFLDDDQRIHRLLASMAHNKYLQDAADKILVHNLRFWRFYFSSRSPQPGMLTTHQPLLDALERRDAEEARLRMRDHLRDSRQLLNALF